MSHGVVAIAIDNVNEILKSRDLQNYNLNAQMRQNIPSMRNRTAPVLVGFAPGGPPVAPCVFGCDVKETGIALTKKKISRCAYEPSDVIHFQGPSIQPFISIVKYDV